MKIQKNVSLDVQVVQDIQELADEDRRTFSSYVNEALRRHIEQAKKQGEAAMRGEKPPFTPLY